MIVPIEGSDGSEGAWLNLGKGGPFLRVVPGGGAEKPTLWWAASRFMQGARRFHELQGVLAQVATDWKSYPRVLKDPGGSLLLAPLDDEFLATRPHASALASEAIAHFRASLDSAVYQLSWHATGRRPSGTMFPFCRDASKWSTRRRTDLKGLHRAHVDAIEAVQPFRGVRWTSLLGTLSNRDKHDHPLEIASIYSWKVDETKFHPDPMRPGRAVLGVEEARIKFVFVPPDRKIDASTTTAATDDLAEIVHGCSDFFNPLLAEFGVSPIVVSTGDPAPATPGSGGA